MQTRERFLFGSEIKAVLAHPEAPRRLDPRAIDDVLTIWSIVPPRTAFEGVYELPPGHSILLSNGELRMQRYWQLDYPQPDTTRSEADYAEELRELLLDATRLRFTSADVPVGAYLSGGLDSTLIAALARRYSEGPLRTFSVAFEDAEFDESEFQRRAIEHLRVDHEQVLCRKQDIADCFADVVWHAEQPIVRSAPAPMYLLARLVRSRGYKVVLTGEGADELFGGYDIFKEAKLRRFWAQHPESRLRPLLLRRLYPYMPALQKQAPDMLRAFFHARPEDLEHPFFSHLPRWELTRKLRLFYSPAMRETLAGYDGCEAIERELPAHYTRWSALCRAQYLETRYLLPGYLLSSQGDRMAMAHGIEGRFPFLDYRLVQFAARLPVQLKMSALREKYLLRRAAGDLIPDALRKRTKQPYRAPDALSFFAPETGRARAEYVEHVLSRERLLQAGIWQPEPVRMLVEKARHGKAVSVRDGMALVSILSTQLLAEQFVERFGRMDDVASS
jgi:asparagine synthase (glutamine-hydrolysing)